MDESNYRSRRLLRVRCEWPYCCRTANKRDEIAPHASCSGFL
jgi:hypothetical protein